MQTDQALIFTDYIHRRVSDYYPGFKAEKTCVRLLDEQKRSAAILYRFQVSSDAETRSMFVKALLHETSDVQPSQNGLVKPLLYPKTDSQDRHRLLYTALVAIYEYFTTLNKDQFGAIRALDYLPEHQAVFMDASKDPSLRHLLLKESRWHIPPVNGKLNSEFRNAGSWLRLYHHMPKKQDVHVRHERRQDYIEAITMLADFLGKSLGEETFLNEAASVLIDQAGLVLPESLPLGLGHGDYAMRNILVGPNHRVTVIDTFAKWRTPIYEDIGYFINELKMSSSQVFSQGIAFNGDQLSKYEDAFLKGYFGNHPVPYPAIRLYEVLALLDKWASFTAKIDHRLGLPNAAGKFGMMLTNRYFISRMKRLLAETSTSA